MKNVGKTDRIVRLLVALLAVVLYFTDVLPGVWGIVAIALASIFLVTSLVSFCPLYAILGINTCRKAT
ncbi:YgaP family membrane protein [Emticicia sp. 17c]|uniref:YgaP family membrane protein n=1 Tax=Emticicia sp. 17c TaxID=3127704 RepID=UPI00301E4602